MLGKLLVLPYGTTWNLRTKCFSASKLVRKVSRIIYEIYQYENNSSIAVNANIKSEPCFPHGMKSIFISGNAVLGANCVIFQQVTIGSVSLSDSKNSGSPVIGDNVYIGAGAKIVGAVKVGNNVRIGANAIVYKDIPDNHIVVAAEQRVIEKESYSDNKYYSFSDKGWVYFDEGQFKPVESPKVIAHLNKSFGK
jgi:serine O-acetyltransferase